MILFKIIINSIIRKIYKFIKYDKDFYLNANAANYINRINDFQKLNDQISKRKIFKQSYLKFDPNKSNKFINNKFIVDLNKIYI